ncbi:hypothetical protein B0H13DRAFT_2649362 [Mycena leptocephala]|nr:hypothetical protein B0H13DRAFT_2649362 [Mycena leptocephala]
MFSLVSTPASLSLASPILLASSSSPSLTPYSTASSPPLQSHSTSPSPKPPASPQSVSLGRSAAMNMGFYTTYMLVIMAVLKDPNFCPSAKFPTDPCLIVICPTIPLQLEMASKMVSVGLSALAVNSNTYDEAQISRNEDLWITVRTGVNVVIAGPEQLKSDKFEKALRDDVFFNRICVTRCTSSI